ncbi:MAG: hypothetical protein ABI346_01640 [Candidatus Baltobacteraceae bacterium]
MVTLGPRTPDPSAKETQFHMGTITRMLVSGALLSAALSGCSAAQVADSFCGGPPPNFNPVAPQELYPVPSWTKVPDNAPDLVVAYNPSNGPLKTIEITPQGGSADNLGGLLSPPNPLPTPIAQELKPGTPMWAVALPALEAHTTYSVGYTFTNTYCGHSATFTDAMGTFTTI